MCTRIHPTRSRTSRSATHFELTPARGGAQLRNQRRRQPGAGLTHPAPAAAAAVPRQVWRCLLLALVINLRFRTPSLVSETRRQKQDRYPFRPLCCASRLPRDACRGVSVAVAPAAAAAAVARNLLLRVLILILLSSIILFDRSLQLMGPKDTAVGSFSMRSHKRTKAATLRVHLSDRSCCCSYKPSTACHRNSFNVYRTNHAHKL